MKESARNPVAVLGTGPGGLAIAADLSAAGRSVVVGDLPEFAEALEAVRANGGVTVASPWVGEEVVPVAVADGIPDAVASVALVIVSVPALAHARFVEAVAPHLREGASLVFMGEGSGSLIARRVLVAARREDVLLGETNCLPFIARPAGPGTVTVTRKRGGVLIAALPASNTERLRKLVAEVWPMVEPTSSVFETILVNYDAIDIVPVAMANAGTLEGRAGGVLLWGEGATPSVVRLIEGLDGELLELRLALGSTDRRRYRDFLIAQGLAPDVGELYSVMRAGGIVQSVRTSGGFEALESRLSLEVPWALVLARSIGDAVGIQTPVIDGLIAVAAAMLGRDLAAGGRTLASLGLAGLDARGLRASVGMQGPAPG